MMNSSRSSVNTTTLDSGMFTHITLNTIRAAKMKHLSEGEVVIAVDSSSWRKAFFPYYKFRRSTNRAASTVNWPSIFEMMDSVVVDLRTHFPYRVVKTHRAEADDIVGTLTERFGRDVGGERIVIISGDKDFRQLQKWSNVTQYDILQKKTVRETQPDQYLLDHILAGDSSDGIPNVLSDDDTFVSPEKRNTPLTKKKKAELFSRYENGELQKTANWIRNETLVDLSKTPNEIKDAIIAEYDSQAGKGRSKMFNYFVSKRLPTLLECIHDF